MRDADDDFEAPRWLRGRSKRGIVSTVSTATAHSNIALVKYWGKRDVGLNLPAAGSLSLALEGLTTTTSVERIGDADADRVELDGTDADDAVRTRVTRFIDLIRERAQSDDRVAVVSRNDFPTAAGLASSASGFAALAAAAADAFGLKLSGPALSALARRGSGSAARSIPGGWAMMASGDQADGRDAFASQLAGADHWDLRCVVLITTAGSKSVGSTRGMRHTQETSPFYESWIESVDADLTQARAAVLSRDFDVLAMIAERSCLRMHATAMGADPGILYWNGATTELIHRVRDARRSGAPVFFTIDAGPHVKVFCPPEAVDRVISLADDLTVQTIVSGPGGPTRLTETR